jgi:hypothetical protein
VPPFPAIIAYIVAWIVMPRDDRPAGQAAQAMHDWSHELHNEANRLADEARRVASEVRAATRGSAWHAAEAYPPEVDAYATAPTHRRNGRHGRSAGVVLVVLGILLLSANVGFFNFIDWNLIWPLIVIVLGLALLARQADWGR